MYKPNGCLGSLFFYFSETENQVSDGLMFT